jgi:hypothetical protein
MTTANIISCNADADAGEQLNRCVPMWSAAIRDGHLTRRHRAMCRWLAGCRRRRGGRNVFLGTNPLGRRQRFAFGAGRPPSPEANPAGLAALAA